MNTQTHLLIAAALLCRPNAPMRNTAVITGALAPDLGVYGLWAWSKAAGVPERDVWSTIYFAEPMQTIQAVANSVPLYALLLLSAYVFAAHGGRYVRERTVGSANTRRALKTLPKAHGTGSIAGEQRLATSRPAAPPASHAATARRGPFDVPAGVRKLHLGLPALAIFAIAALLHIAGDLPVHADDAHRHFWPLSDWRFHSPVSYWNPDQGGAWFSFTEAAIGIGAAVLLFRRFRSVWVRAMTMLAITAYVAVPAYFTLMLGG